MYLAAVLEYPVAEVLELAGNTAKLEATDEYASSYRITPQHIFLGMRADPEMHSLVTASSAVLPTRTMQWIVREGGAWLKPGEFPLVSTLATGRAKTGGFPIASRPAACAAGHVRWHEGVFSVDGSGAEFMGSPLCCTTQKVAVDRKDEGVPPSSKSQTKSGMACQREWCEYFIANEAVCRWCHRVGVSHLECCRCKHADRPSASAAKIFADWQQDGINPVADDTAPTAKYHTKYLRDNILGVSVGSIKTFAKRSGNNKPVSEDNCERNPHDAVQILAWGDMRNSHVC